MVYLLFSKQETYFFIIIIASTLPFVIIMSQIFVCPGNTILVYDYII